MSLRGDGIASRKLQPESKVITEPYRTGKWFREVVVTYPESGHARGMTGTQSDTESQGTRRRRQVSSSWDVHMGPAQMETIYLCSSVSDQEAGCG